MCDSRATAMAVQLFDPTNHCIDWFKLNVCLLMLCEIYPLNQILQFVVGHLNDVT